jgi:hypothetical protein
VGAGSGACSTPLTAVTVTVNDPATPSAANQSVTCGETATLTASGSIGNYIWYSDAGGTNQVGTGSSFTTPILTSNTTYYVSASNGGTPSQLATTQVGGNGCMAGNMFDITTGANALNITGFTVTPRGSGTQVVTVFYRTGTYNGFQTNQGAWTTLGDYSISGTVGVPIYVNTADLALNASTVYGVYVRYNGQYTTGANTYSNADMTITTGQGHCSSFDGCCAPRTFNGIVHYTVPPECESALDPVTVTVNPLPAPTSVLATPNPVCEGASTSLSASLPSGANSALWYNFSFGGTSQGTGVTYNTGNLNTPGTVTMYAASYNTITGCESLARTSVDITVHEEPTAPTVVNITSGLNPLCSGNSITLQAAGGTEGSGATYEWREGNCTSGTVIGTSSSITVTPSSTTTYYVRRVPTTANACTNVTGCASISITVTDPPTPFAGVDQTQCGLTAYTINDAGLGNGTLGTPGWSTSLSGGSTATFSGLNTLTPTITPTSATGSVTMTINVDGVPPCSAGSDFMVMSWTASPQATAGDDIVSCGTSAVYFTTSSATAGSTVGWTLLTGQPGESGSGTIIDPLTTNDPTTWGFQPTSATGVRYVALTSAPPPACSSPNIMDIAMITWGETPSVSLTTPLNSCTGDAPILLSGASAGTGSLNWSVVTATSGSASFTAGTNTNNPTFDPSTTSGQYTVEFTITGTGACLGFNDSELMTINWDASPVFTAGPDFSACEVSPVSISGSSISSVFSSMTWVDLGTGTGTGSFTTTHPTDPAQWVYTPTSAGTVDFQLQVTGSGSVCSIAPATDNVTITFENGPTVDAGPIVTGLPCTGSAAITLSGASANNSSSYSWTENAFPTTGTLGQGTLIDNAQFTPGGATGSTTLMVTVMGTGTCSAESASDTRLVNWFTPPSIDEVDVLDVTDCNDPNGAIAVLVTGVHPLNYSIDNGSSYSPDSLFQDVAVGSYDIVVEDGNGCSSTFAGNSVVLNGPSTPVFTVTTTDVLCSGAEDGTIEVTVTSGGTPWYAIEAVTAVKTYQDTAFSLNNTIGLDVVAGTYYITVTDVFGCSTTLGPYEITEPPAMNVSTVVQNNTNCTGTDGSITVTASGGTPGYQYSFNGGSFTGGNLFSNIGTGSYPIIVRDNNSCEITFEESIGGPFEVNAGNDRYLCEGSSLTMNAQMNVNAITSAATGGNYSQSSIDYAPRTPSWTYTPLSDDQVSTWINLGFMFNFYGNNYNQFRISSNGFITFDNATNSGCCNGQNLPNGGAPNNLIALCWEDLDPPESGGIIRHGFIGSAPNRVYVVEYNNVRHYPNNVPITGQIHLYESTNNIEIHNTDVRSYSGNNTMGIENAGGTLGVTTNFGSGSSWVEVNTAYLYEPPVALGAINYTWSPPTGLNNANILNPTVSGITSDQTYTLQVDIVGVCTLDDDMTIYVSGLSNETSGTYGTAPNVSTATDVICNGDDDGCISVVPTTGHAPYLLEGPNGEVQVYQGRMKEVTVSNPTGSNLTDYQVKMTVSYEGQMRADFGDLRFYDGSSGNFGDLLYYWVESYSLANTATLYVKVPSLPTGGTTLYMLYGNSALTTQSDPDNTLWWYEDAMDDPTNDPLVNSTWNASYINHQFMKLTPAASSRAGTLRRNVNISNGGNGFVADFEFWIGGGNGADGLWLFSDQNNVDNNYLNEDQNLGGYCFVYDTWQNQHQIKHNGNNYGTNAESNHDNSTWRDGKVEQWRTTGRMFLDGVLRIQRTTLPDDNIGNYFGFAARTGGANNEHRIRNIRVRKLAKSGGGAEPTVSFGSEQVSNNQFCGVTPGTYTISVWDAADCDITEVDITIDEPPVLSITGITITDTWCYNNAQGELDITVTGGTTPYVYSWSGPSSFTSSAEDLTGLAAGLYGVVVLDDNACTDNANAIVGTDTPINIGHYTWIGTTSGLWQTSTNWDCGLPDAASEVIIPAAPSGGNYPIIQSGVIGDVLNIEIQGGTSDLLQIEPGGLLRIHQ